MSMLIKITKTFIALFILLISCGITHAQNSEKPVIGVGLTSYASNVHVKVKDILQFDEEAPANSFLNFQLIKDNSNPEAFSHFIQIYEGKENIEYSVGGGKTSTKKDTFKIGPFKIANADKGKLYMSYESFLTIKFLDLKTSEFLGSINYIYQKIDSLEIPELGKKNLRRMIPSERTVLALEMARKHRDKINPKKEGWKKEYGESLKARLIQQAFFRMLPSIDIMEITQHKKDKAQNSTIKVWYSC